MASLLPQTPHTARSPFLLVRATHAPISTLNTCADTLAVASAARSAAVNVEIGRVDAPSDFWSTLATCTSSTVGAAAAGTVRLRVACARQACAGARPGAQASALRARRPARHRWLSGRPRSRAPVSRKHARSCWLVWPIRGERRPFGALVAPKQLWAALGRLGGGSV